MAGSNASARQATLSFLKLGAGEVLARALSFVAVVYLARRLGTEAYGMVGFAGAVMMYFVAVTDFGIEALGPREVAANPTAARGSTTRILLARVLIGCTLAVIVASGGFFLMGQPDGAVLALYALLLLPTGASSRWVHIGLEQAGRVAVARVLGEALRAALVLLLVTSAASLFWAVAAHVLGEALTALILLFALRGWLQWRSDRTVESVRPLLRRASPLAVTALLGLVIYNSDLVLLRLFRGVEPVGIYLAAFTLIALLGNLAGTYGSALLPSLTRASVEDGSRVRLFVTALSQVLAVAVPVTVGGIFLAPQIIDLFFTSEYVASGPILQVLMISIFLLLGRAVIRAALIASGLQRQDMWIAAVAAAVSLGSNLLVIPRFGAIGAAWTTVGTEVVRSALSVVWAARAGFPLPGLPRLWRTALGALAMVGAFSLLEEPSLAQGLAVGSIAYLVVLAVTGGIRWKPGHLPELRV